MVQKRKNIVMLTPFFKTQTAGWFRSYFDSVDFFGLGSIVRRGFLAQACPVFIGGISGPGAPHWFEFQKRESLGTQVKLTVIVASFQKKDHIKQFFLQMGS